MNFGNHPAHTSCRTPSVPELQHARTAPVPPAWPRPAPGNRTVYRFVFHPPVNMAAVEATLADAIRAAGCLHGDAAVRLAVAYAIDPNRRTVDLEIGTLSGTAVARLFVGACTDALGEEGFRVLHGSSPAALAPSDQFPSRGKAPPAL